MVIFLKSFPGHDLMMHVSKAESKDSKKKVESLSWATCTLKEGLKTRRVSTELKSDASARKIRVAKYIGESFFTY